MNLTNWNKRPSYQRKAILVMWTILCDTAEKLLQLDAMPMTIAGAIVQTSRMIAEADNGISADDIDRQARMN